jgi:hypothetical protein
VKRRAFLRFLGLAPAAAAVAPALAALPAPARVDSPSYLTDPDAWYIKTPVDDYVELSQQRARALAESMRRVLRPGLERVFKDAYSNYRVLP